MRPHRVSDHGEELVKPSANGSAQGAPIGKRAPDGERLELPNLLPEQIGPWLVAHFPPGFFYKPPHPNRLRIATHDPKYGHQTM
jgi:hypothetical protein